MSHYPGTEKYGYPDFDFDQYLLRVIESGELSSLLSLSSQKLDEAGETELLTWYTVFGAIGNTRGKVLSYQPTWHHGLGVIDFPLATPLEGLPRVESLPKAMEVSSTGYRYYKFPEPESYNLNRLLYALRMKAGERQRFVQNMDGMLTEYQLRPQEMVAVRTLDPLKVAQAGAHPILAWTAVHLVAADMRAQELKSGSSNPVSDS